MTVIAYKDGVMAADTQLTGGGPMNHAQKIVRLPDGGVAGGAGVWSRAYAGLKWLAGGEQGEAPDLTGACLMIVRADGGISFVDEAFPDFPILDSCAAIGCGADAATMAMRLGKSAVEAVQAVTGQDAGCGGLIQSLEVVEIEAFPGVRTYSAAESKAKAKIRGRAKAL